MHKAHILAMVTKECREAVPYEMLPEEAAMKSWAKQHEILLEEYNLPINILAAADPGTMKYKTENIIGTPICHGSHQKYLIL